MSFLNEQEQDMFCHLVRKISDAIKVVPNEVKIKARDMLVFCRMHLPENGQEYIFPCGRQDFEIKTDTKREGFKWNSGDYASYSITVTYKFKWSADHVSVYHNDTERVETAVVDSEVTAPFILNGPRYDLNKSASTML